MLIYYTTEEGGLWRPLETERSADEIIAQLRLHWRPLLPRRSSRIVNGADMIDVHAVLFPSGDVWDSHYGRVRGTDEANYYEIMQEALGHHGKEEGTEEEEWRKERLLDGDKETRG